MKTNRVIDPAVDHAIRKRKRLSAKALETSKKDWQRYNDDVKKSDGFEVGDYPHLDPRPLTGYHMVQRVYDSSHTEANLEDDLLLCMAKLAMCFYNIKEDTHYHDVQLVMATKSGIKYDNCHITFKAFAASTSTTERVAVTFQTKVYEPLPYPYPRFEIIFVRIKPSDQDQPSESDSKAQIYQHRLSQVIETYTIDSQLDSRYGLALYLSQYALVCHDLFTLSGLVVAKHDIELLNIVKLMKPVAEDPTYLITFKAPLRAKSMRKKFYTFKAEICMHCLFPTTYVQLKSSELEVVTEKMVV